MRRRVYLLLPVVLAGCFGPPPPQQLDFATSSAIFRGTYETDVDMRVSWPDVALNSDSTVLAMANGDFFHALQFWDVEAVTPTGTVEQGFVVASVTMSPDDSKIAAVLPGQESHLPGGGRVWDIESGEVIHKLPPNSPTCPKCLAQAVAISPDGSTLALLSRQSYGYSESNKSISEVSLYDMDTGERLTVLSGPPHAQEAFFGEVSFSPDGSRLAAIATDTYDRAFVRVWDVQDSQVLGTYGWNTRGRYQANAHMWQDNAPVLGIYGREQLELVNAMTGQEVMTLPLPDGDLLLYYLYANPDGSRLLGGAYGRLVLWDLEAEAILEVLPGDNHQAAGFSPDGQYALAYDGTTRTLTLRDPDTLEIEKSLVNGEVLPLRLKVEASYGDSSSYRVEGTAQFGDETPVPFTGVVEGNGTQRYTSPRFSSIDPTPATLEISFDRNGRAWNLQAHEDIWGTTTWGRATLSERSSFSQYPWIHEVELRKGR